jgi:hypothetical protein
MPTNVQVKCIRKRGDHYNPHERIEGLGGDGWYWPEEAIIAEIEKPEYSRQWNFFTYVGGKWAWVIVATHSSRKYLKTDADGYAPNNLLSLPECP